MARRIATRFAILILVTALAPLVISSAASGMTSTVTIHVRVTDFPSQAPLSGSGVFVYNSFGDWVRNYETDGAGQVDISLPRGSYYLTYHAYSGDGRYWDVETDLLNLTFDQTVQLTPESHPLALEITNEEGAGVNASGRLSCEGPRSRPFSDEDPMDYTQDLTVVGGLATTTVPVLGSGSPICSFILTSDGDGEVFGRTWDSALTTYATTVAPAANLTVNVTTGLGDPPEPGYGGYVLLKGGPSNFPIVSTKDIANGSASFYVEQGTWDIQYESNGSPWIGYLSRFGGTNRVSLTGDQAITLGPEVRPLTIHVQDSSGAVTGANVRVWCEAPAGDGGTQTLNVDVMSLFDERTIPALQTASGAPACRIVASQHGKPDVDVMANASDPAENHVTVVIPDIFPVNGRLSGGSTGALSSGRVLSQPVSATGWLNGIYATVTDSSYTLPLSSGDYRLLAEGTVDDQIQFSIQTRTFPVTTSTSLLEDLAPDLTPVRVHLRQADGTPGNASVFLRCERTGGSNALVDHQTSELNLTVQGTAVLRGMAGTDEAGRPACFLQVSPQSGSTAHQRLTLDPNGASELVVYLDSGVVVDTSGPPADVDGVPDGVEALAPNEGDGNNDGVADSEQGNVTSVPGNGGDTDQPFVTIAGPTGTTLSAVSTLAIDDPSIADTPPPPGVELPHGLAQFTLEGVDPGSTHVVSIYPSSTAGLTSYAKFDGVNWTTLPPSRVAISSTRVDITLTDGGIGDDDGVINGVIVDPGGPAIVTSTQPSDLALSAVADVTVNATTHNGGKATFTKPVVTGSLPDNPSPVCTKSSGATFPIGSTTVTCTVTDVRYANSPVSGSFTVKVLGAAEQLAALRTSVIGVGSGKVLQTAVEKVQAKLAAGNNKTTCKALIEFGVVVATQLLAKKITVSKAATLAATAVRIGTVLRC